MVPPVSHRVPRAPCYSGTLTVTQGSHFRIQDFHLLRFNFPEDSSCDAFVTVCQCPQHPEASFQVWASPLSLAATYGVSVDFLSYRYLDVSVPYVRFTWPIHSAMDDAIWLPSDNGLPHSDIPGLTDTRLLPRAYRSLSRPSSPLNA